LTLEMLLRGLYTLPKLAGQGPHWPLNDDEAAILAEQLEACLHSLPARQMEKASKFVARVAPWVGLTTTAIVVTYARYAETEKLRRAYAARQPIPNGSGQADSDHRRGTGAADGNATSRVSRFFGEGQG
jgi:hypothetical protein